MSNENANDKNVTRRCDSKQWECGLGSACARILTKVKQNDRPFCFKDFCYPKTRENNDFHPLLSHGYFRNCICKLKQQELIEPLSDTNPRFYILKEWHYRYLGKSVVTPNPIRVKTKSSQASHSLEPKKTWTNFCAFLESLVPTELVHIHDVHLRFSALDFGFVDEKWKWFKQGGFWNQCFDFSDGWSCKVNAYKNTKTVSVSVGCKFFYSSIGLLRLAVLLGGVKERLGNVPDPMSWIVSLWHYGKDFRCAVRGRDFEVCFETFSGCLGRIYNKHGLSVIRFEEVQTPDKSLARLFEEVLFSDGTKTTKNREDQP
jgi:hypothetical protein